MFKEKKKRKRTMVKTGPAKTGPAKPLATAMDFINVAAL